MFSLLRIFMFSLLKKYTLDQYLEKESSRFLSQFPKATLGIGVFQNGKKTMRYFWRNIDEKNPIFEIGSITKIFTNILLSYYIEKVRVTLGNTLWDILGHTYEIAPLLRDITLEDLSTHTSGLPSFSDGWVNTLEDFESFPQKFSRKELVNYLTNPGKLGKRGVFSYSNLWVGLLGFCLEEISGESLDTLYKKYIFSPLHMNHSGIAIAGALHWYSQKWEEKWYVNWWEGVFIGAGWIRSSIDDMLWFIKWNFGDIWYIKTPQERIHWKNTWLGWMMPTFIDKLFGNGTTIWHDGATPGFSSYIALDLERNNGIILLINQYTTLNFLGILFMRKVRKLDDTK